MIAFLMEAKEYQIENTPKPKPFVIEYDAGVGSKNTEQVPSFKIPSINSQRSLEHSYEPSSFVIPVIVRLLYRRT